MHRFIRKLIPVFILAISCFSDPVSSEMAKTVAQTHLKVNEALSKRANPNADFTALNVSPLFADNSFDIIAFIVNLSPSVMLSSLLKPVLFLCCPFLSTNLL